MGRKIFLFVFMILFAFSGTSSAQNISPARIKLPGEQHFIFSLGVGYGISNNPCRECTGKSTGGLTVAFSLGYKVNKICPAFF